MDEPKRIRGRGEYYLPPTSPKGKRPEGWVDTSPLTGTSVRRITPGYISQRLPRTNTVAMNQAYIRKIITNPRTPQCNRDAAIRFVIDNPDRFTTRPTNTGDPVFDDHNRRRSGASADPHFIARVKALVGRTRRSMCLNRSDQIMLRC